MANAKRDIEAEFLKDIATHEMSILLDQNTYRHLRFKKPASGNQWFDIVTWPGYLAYTGDMGSFVFERVHDMLTFFRGKRREGHLDINPPYWAEKLRAVDRDGRSGSFEEYSETKIREHIEEDVKRWIEEFEGPYDADEEEVAAARKVFEDELRAAIKDNVLAYVEDGEHKAREMVNEFSFKPEKIRFGGRDNDRTYEFQDSWEWNCRDYTLRFLWCCYALVWAIEKYDAVKAEAAIPSEVPA